MTANATSQPEPPQRPLLPSPFPSWVRRVGLCLPAGLPESRLIAAGCRQLCAWGIQPVFTAPRAAGAIQASRYLSGSDAERAAELLALLADPTVDVILAVRGGFGCARLFPQIAPAQLTANPKPIIGYSDLTALHALSFAAGLGVNIAGPMLAVEFARLETTGATSLPAPDLAFTFRSLQEAWSPRKEVSLPAGTELTVWRGGCAQGRLFPATLTVLTSLFGTPYFPDLSGAILVLEDINEPCYRLDRCLNQLRQAGILQRLAGLIWGSFSGTENAEWLPQLYREYSIHVAGPVAGGLPHGHVTPSLAVPVGRIARLRTAEPGVAELAW